MFLVLKEKPQNFIDHQKLHFGCYWRLITFFLVFKNTASIVFKAKQNKNIPKNLFLKGFYLKT